MRTKRGIGLKAGAAVVCASAAAWAGFVQDAETWSGVSGPAAAHEHTVVTQAEYYALRGLKVYDYDGRACVIEVGQASLNGGKNMSDAGKLRACEQRSSESWKYLDVGSGFFITAIETCAQRPDAGGAKLRGIRVQSAAVNPDGSLKSAKEKTEILLGECKKWEPRKSCPKGAVATGLRAMYDDESSGFTGLELRCHTLKTTPKAGDKP
jgi:hypothetical protein